jgi:integrase
VSALYTELIDRGLAPKTVQLTHTVLHRALTQGVRWGRLARNVATLVDPPRIPSREAASLTPAELARLREAARGNRLGALFILAMLTGMRRGELLALRWDAVDLERCAIEVRATMQQMPGGPIRSEPKSQASRRTIALGGDAVAAVQTHRAGQIEERLRAANVWDSRGDDYVFTSELGRPVSPTTLARAWSALLARAELPSVPFHALRHAATTLAVVANVAPKVTASRLGHATAAITLDRYSHVTDELERAAAQAIEATLRLAERSTERDAMPERPATFA